MADPLSGISEGAQPSPGLILADVSRLLRKYFEQRARADNLGLTRAQGAALWHLSRREGINQAALAQIMEIEPISLVRLLDRLETAGFVERRRDPQDRRAWALYLTPAARPPLERIKALSAKVWERAMDRLSEAERAAFITTMSIIKSNLVDLLSKEETILEDTIHG